MTLNNIFKKEQLFDYTNYELANKIITDDVVGVAFCALKKFNESTKNTAVLAQNLFIAEQIRDILIDFVGNENIIYLPSEELVESEFLASSPDIRCDRITGLVELLKAEHKIIIMNVATAIRYYPSPELFASRYKFNRTIVKLKEWRVAADFWNFGKYHAKESIGYERHFVFDMKDGIKLEEANGYDQVYTRLVYCV